MTPQISVVVPTFRRTEPLRRCLVALLSQSVPAADYEIVVVNDDDRSDAVDRLVHELQQASLNATAGHAPTLVYLRPRHGCGPAVARNCGWRAARGRLIAFIDDDTVPHPRWLELGRQAMQQNRSWSALCGRVAVPRNALGAARGAANAPPLQGEFVAANAFVWRSALVRVNGFDERHGPLPHPERDLQLRLARGVGPVGRCEHVVVVQPAPRAPAEARAPGRYSAYISSALGSMLPFSGAYRRLCGALRFHMLMF